MYYTVTITVPNNEYKGLAILCDFMPVPHTNGKVLSKSILDYGDEYRTPYEDMIFDVNDWNNQGIPAVIN